MVQVVGKINTEYEEAYVLADGNEVTFHTCYLNSLRTEQVTFMCPMTTWPSIVAHDKGLKYVFMRNATREEALNEIALQGLEVKKVIEI